MPHAGFSGSRPSSLQGPLFLALAEGSVGASDGMAKSRRVFDIGGLQSKDFGDSVDDDARQQAAGRVFNLHDDDAGALRILRPGKPNFSRRSTTGITLPRRLDHAFHASRCLRNRGDLLNAHDLADVRYLNRDSSLPIWNVRYFPARRSILGPAETAGTGFACMLFPCPNPLSIYTVITCGIGKPGWRFLGTVSRFGARHSCTNK